MSTVSLRSLQFIQLITSQLSTTDKSSSSFSAPHLSRNLFRNASHVWIKESATVYICMSPKTISGENMTAFESEEVEKWLDQNGTFFKDYFLRKVSTCKHLFSVARNPAQHIYLFLSFNIFSCNLTKTDYSYTNLWMLQRFVDVKEKDF